MAIDFKIVHVFNDEKFVDTAIALFEDVYPNTSIYYVLQSVQEPFQYVTSDRAKSLLYTNEGDLHNIKQLILKNQTDVVFFHALDTKKQHIVNSLPGSILKVWLIWGFDLYWNWKLLKVNMFEAETQRYLYGAAKNTSLIRRLFFNNFGLWLFTMNRNKKLPLPQLVIKKLEHNFFTDFYKVVQQIDIVVPVVPTEYDYVKRINNKLISAAFEYGTIEGLAIDERRYGIDKANNILIGNSASPTNNHVDAFKQVAKYRQPNQKVIVPLSYGGKQHYVDFVLQKGHYYFGEDFLPILNFMPLADYKKLISSCGFAVFNHRRQQALGNINTMGYYGAKLFLNSKSPIFKYFKAQDVKIFDVNTMNSDSFSTALNEIETDANKAILEKLYSKDAVHQKVSELISIVHSKLRTN